MKSSMSHTVQKFQGSSHSHIWNQWRSCYFLIYHCCPEYTVVRSVFLSTKPPRPLHKQGPCWTQQATLQGTQWLVRERKKWDPFSFVFHSPLSLVTKDGLSTRLPLEVKFPAIIFSSQTTCTSKYQRNTQKLVVHCTAVLVNFEIALQISKLKRRPACHSHHMR